MRTIETTLYNFSELSEEAKKKAIEKLSDINVSYDWWEFIYEDAENIGLKITSFDLDRNRHAKGEFITSAPECAESILNEHGDTCETYSTAQTLLNRLSEVEAKWEGRERTNEEDNELDELEDEFLKSLLEDYSIMLEKECEYLQSEKAIIETIEANDYEFDEDGNLA